MNVEGFKIISHNESTEKNSEQFEQFSRQIDQIRQKTEQIKQRYGVEDIKMASFSPDLLPTSKQPMMLEPEVFDDYQRILQQTIIDGKEHNFVWLGRRRLLDDQEYYAIEKVINIPEREEELRQSEVSPAPKIYIYDDTKAHKDYDIIVDGHSHPTQDPSYMGFDQLPQPLLDELSLKNPGENFSISDLNYYATLLSIGPAGKNIKEKTIIGAVIAHTGSLLTIVSDSINNQPILTTVRQVGADINEGVATIPTSTYDKEKSDRFFEIH